MGIYEELGVTPIINLWGILVHRFLHHTGSFRLGLQTPSTPRKMKYLPHKELHERNSVLAYLKTLRQVKYFLFPYLL